MCFRNLEPSLAVLGNWEFESISVFESVIGFKWQTYFSGKDMHALLLMVSASSVHCCCKQKPKKWCNDLAGTVGGRAKGDGATARSAKAFP